MLRTPFVCVHRPIVRWLTIAVSLLGPGWAAAPAYGQGSQLVPLLTDQTVEPVLSSSFGPVTGAAVNQRRDFVFTSGSASSLFLRMAGSAAPIRIVQAGDELPEFPGGRVTTIAPPSINNAGVVAFVAAISLPTGAQTEALYSYDSGGLHLITSGGSFTISLAGINDAGTIAFRAAPGGTASLHLARPGVAPLRLVGTGDEVPGSAGRVFSSITLVPGGLNGADHVLFRGALSSTEFGFFVASEGGVERIVATGDPLPGSGTPAVPSSTVGAVWSDAGIATVVVSNAIWQHTTAAGLTRLIGVGDPAPGMSGTVGFISQLSGNGVGGAVARVTVGTLRALLHVAPGPPALVAAESPAGTPGLSFGSIPSSGSASSVSMNATGSVMFPAFLRGSDGQLRAGLFLSPGEGSNAVLLNDFPTPLPSGETYWLGNSLGAPYVTFLSLLDDLGFVFATRLRNGPAEAGVFDGDLGALVTTADPLPPGSRAQIAGISGAGDYIGFTARRAGGQLSLGIHHIEALDTRILVTEGDVAPDGEGSRFLSLAAFAANAAGDIAFLSALADGSSGSGIFVVHSSGGVSKVAVEQQIRPGEALPFGALSFTSAQGFTDAGDVLFAASGRVYVGRADAAPVRVVGPGDPLPGGGALGAVSGRVIGDTGVVAFAAAGGVYVKPPGAALIDVARIGGPAPGGATFSQLGLATLTRVNRSGEFLFVGAWTDPASGQRRMGVFVGSASGWTAVALEGEPGIHGSFGITAGGTLLFLTSPGQINDAGDVVFATIGPEGGVYVRRSGGAVEAVARAGTPAPGSSGVFTAMGSVHLDHHGNIALVASAPPIGEDVWNGIGLWHITPDDDLGEILVRGTIAPEFGGGAIVNNAWSTTWNSEGRFAVTGVISGGTFLSGVFLYVPADPSSTPAGDNVVVTPSDGVTNAAPVTLAFSRVDEAGETTLTISAGGPTVPSAFALGNPPLFYNLETTAVFSGAITICIDTSGTSFANPSALRLLHYTGAWVDITTSVLGTVVCGSTPSLSPFTVAELLAPSDGEPPVVTVPASFSREAPAADGMVVTFTATAVDLVDGAVPVLCQPASGSMFPIGSTLVTCSAVDAAGNQGASSFTITLTEAVLDGRMHGSGLFTEHGQRHHVVFRATQNALIDSGRFEYFVTPESTFEIVSNGDGTGDASYGLAPAGALGRFEAQSVAVAFEGSAPAPGVTGVLADAATLVGHGRWNGQEGYTFEAVLTDGGQPGAGQDSVGIVIRNGGGSVIVEASGMLEAGNVVSTRVRR